MLKKHMAACLVATAFMAAPALAQTSSSSSSASSGAAASQSGQFMTHMNPDQWRGSKLVGVNIYGQNNEKIGDVNEVLIDRKGNADAIVVGVGGFLGMGEKDVALPFSAVEWKYDRNDLSTASTNRPATTGTTAANPPASGSMAANPPATGTTGAPATTGTTAANRPATADRSNMDRGYPDHGVVKFSKDESEERADVPLQHDRRHLARERPGPHHGPGRTPTRRQATTAPPRRRSSKSDRVPSLTKGPAARRGLFVWLASGREADSPAPPVRPRYLRSFAVAPELRKRTTGPFVIDAGASALLSRRELRPKARLRKRQAASSRRFEPRVDRNAQFRHSFLRSTAVRRARAQVRRVRNPGAVLRRTRRPRMRSGSRRLINLQAELDDHIPKLAHLIWLRVLADRLHVQRPLGRWRCT